MPEIIIDGWATGSPLRVYDDGSVNSRLLGSGGYSLGYDKSSKAVTSIDYAHHELHDGNHYNIRGFSAPINSGVFFTWCVTTPNGSKWAHMTYQIEGTTQTEIYVYEGANCSGGTAITPRNNNRNAGDNSILTIKQGAVISGTNGLLASGTLIESHSKGFEGATPSKASVNAEVTREDEMILKSGTTYVYVVKSVGTGNILDFAGTWYEHTDREKIW